MGPIGRLRFSTAKVMMFVLAAGAASALFAKVHQHSTALAQAGWKTDIPSLLILAIGLSAVALGSWKEHSAVQIMLQFALACVGGLILIEIGEARQERVIRYWFQGTFAATVTIPMLARRYVKAKMPRGAKRDWWKKTWEAVFFSFVNMMLVTVGWILQAAIYLLGSEVLTLPTGS